MTFREVLKAATVDIHGQIDRMLSRYDLGEPRGYRSFLEVHAEVLPACEILLEASGAALLIDDWAQRVRSPALTEDLDDVGGRHPPGARLSCKLTPAAAFGMMYVLEGSRLGGKVLARRVLANPDARCREATRYLRHGQGQRLWPSFLAAFEASAAVRQAPALVIASAVQTFGLFEQAAQRKLAA